MYNQYPRDNMAYYGTKPGQKKATGLTLWFKYILICLTIFLFLVACSVLGVSLWILLDKTYVGELFGTDLIRIAGIILVCGACVLLCVSLVGTVASAKENKKLLFGYFITMVVICLLLIVVGILAIVFRAKIGDEVRDYMTRTIQDRYDEPGEEEITKAWDKAQDHLHCCGVLPNGYSVYRGSLWINKQPGLLETSRVLVPLSCCVKDQYGIYLNAEYCQKYRSGPPYVNSGNNPALHSLGCYDEGRRYLFDYSGAFIGIGFAIACVLLGCVVLSFILYRSL